MMNSFTRIGFILILLLLAACEPSNQPLPTLVRFPTETETPVNIETQVAGVRSTLPATFTPTFTPTATPSVSPAPGEPAAPSATITPSPTITVTSSATPTDLPTISPEERPLLALALTALAATVLPTDFVVPPYTGINVTLAPTFATLAPGMPSAIAPIGQAATPIGGGIPAPACTSIPAGRFGTIFTTNPDIAAQIGCSVAPPQEIPAAWQGFEQGIMVWLNGEILVFYSATDSWQRFDDTFIQGVDPETIGETPPAGRIAPIRGFLKVWNNNPQVRSTLGWGLTPEQGVPATVEVFGNGRMIWLPGRSDVLVLVGSNGGQWYSFAGSY
jgi:hypothetical protein